MSKSLKPILIIGTILIGAIALLAYLSPPQVDWRPTYNTMDKIPMGLYVLDKEIDSLFGSAVERIKYPLHDYFYQGVMEDSTNYSLLYINQENRWDLSDIVNICTFVAQGNTAFISSINIPQELQDSLGVEVYASMFDPMFRKLHDTINIWITDSMSTKIVDKNGLTSSYFLDYDSLTTTVLGVVALDSASMPNFLKIKHGFGHFLIHLEPAVFTNYHLLKRNHHQYAERAFDHIPAHHDIIWSLNDQTSKVISDSPLRFILSQPALKWAWYLLLAGIGMFVLFNIRRSQRIIPIIPKPTNTSVEFVKTIGNLNFIEGDIRSMMDKKIVYLLANIRSKFHLTTEVLDDKFIHLLHVKSGKDEKIVNKMIFLVNKHKEHDYKCTLDDLNRLNTSIEAFYQS